jgi:O-antigen/teichoic acid export membrane protein
MRIRLSPEMNSIASRPGGVHQPFSGLSLSHNFIWTLIGNGVYAACQWAIVVVLAKLGNPSLVGKLALAMAISVPITLLANLQLRAVFVTDLQNKYPFGQMLGARLFLVVVSLAAVAFICKISSYDALSKEVIMLISMSQLVDCLSENYYGICQRYERMDRIAKSQIARSALSLLGFASTLYVTHNLLLAVVAVVCARVVVLLAYDAGQPTFTLGSSLYDLNAHMGLAERIRPHWNLRSQLEMIWVAFPLGAVAIVGALSVNIPRYAIQHYLGQSDLGIYSALNYIPTALLMLTTALGNAVFATLVRLYFHGDLVTFRRLILRGSGVCLAIGMAGLTVSAVAGSQVLAFLYRPEYGRHVDVLLWLMLAAAVGSVTTFLGCAMTATSQFRVQLVLFLVVAASSAGSCCLMIPRLGLAGAAIAALIAMIIQAIGTILIILKGLLSRARRLADGDVPLGIRNVVEA